MSILIVSCTLRFVPIETEPQLSIQTVYMYSFIIRSEKGEQPPPPLLGYGCKVHPITVYSKVQANKFTDILFDDFVLYIIYLFIILRRVFPI